MPRASQRQALRRLAIALVLLFALSVVGFLVFPWFSSLELNNVVAELDRSIPAGAGRVASGGARCLSARLLHRVPVRFGAPVAPQQACATGRAGGRSRTSHSLMSFFVR